jgi:hypothetical protein
MRKQRPSRKPSGLSGGILVGGGQKSEFRPVTWPEGKAGIERMVVDRSFAASGVRGPGLRELYRLVAEPRTNPEQNGFDVLLATETGEQYLDLTEVAPLRGMGGSYGKAPTYYIAGELADLIFAELLEKSKGYGPSPRHVIHLLMYSTDFRFHLGNEVLDLIACRASRGELCFASIIYYAAVSDDDDHLELVHPHPPTDFHGFDEAAVRRRQIALGDLATWTPIPNGAVVKLGAVQRPGPGFGPVTFDFQIPIQVRTQAAPPDAGQPPRLETPEQTDGTQQDVPQHRAPTSTSGQ